MFGVLTQTQNGDFLLITQGKEEIIPKHQHLMFWNLKEIYCIAKQKNLKQIWICNETSFFQSIKESSELERKLFWTVQPNSEIHTNLKFSPKELKNLVTVWVDGEFNSDVQIVFPSLVDDRWGFDKNIDAYSLFMAIDIFVREIGVLPSFPIRTSSKLLDKSHKLELISENPKEYFKPFEMGISALHFTRNLELFERHGKKIFVFDKKQMFLSAMSSLELPVSSYEIIENIKGNSIGTFYFGLCEIEEIIFPNNKKPFWFDYIGGETFLYSPVVLLISQFAEVKIKKAWLWKKGNGKQIFNQFYKTVSKAKQATEEKKNEIEYSIANAAIKSLYTEFVGYLRKDENAESNFAKKYYRPDIRGLIVSNAIANFIRNIISVYDKKGLKPFGISHDAAFYLANDLKEFDETCLTDEKKFSFEYSINKKGFFNGLELKGNLSDIEKAGKNGEK